MIQTTLNNHVLTISINRPNKKNALSPSMYDEMAASIEGAAPCNVRAILIKGSNGVFTSGNDVSEFADANDAGQINETFRFMQALLNCPLPVVAQVEGLAIGIGTTLLFHCDFVIAHEKTKFAMPFINLGLVPEYASSYLVPKISSKLMANKLIMLGEVFDATTALHANIVGEVCADTNTLDTRVNELLSQLVLKPQQALIQTKALINQDREHVKQVIANELEVFVNAMQSDQAKEAFSAFLEKRPINREVFK